MTIIDRIKHHFNESIQAKIDTADQLLPIIATAAERIAQCLLDGHKVMVCGNGSSAAIGLHLTGKMLNRFKHERPGLPAISLNSDIAAMTAIANDFDYTDIFSKQIRALGQTGDVLVAITTQGNSANMLSAVKAAHHRNMNVVAMTGHDGGKMATVLQDSDIEVRVPSADMPRVQETHFLIVHCICDIIDFQLFDHEA
ncbi:phosphoheptose isomerase [Gammaproteobacteria bacterium SCGC AG-212-F23]|nr:phosphoheptose isomerase [Gammaproteobacteria bacterium SCGC AG-212-F23]